MNGQLMNKTLQSLKIFLKAPEIVFRIKADTLKFYKW